MAGEEDQRKVISSNQIQNFPFNCIGVLKGRDKRNRPVFATGFLISDRFVLTSAHIIYIMTNRHEFNSNDLSFQLFDHEHLNIKSFKISNDYLNIQREIQKCKNRRDFAINIREKRLIQTQINQLMRRSIQYDFGLIKLSERIIRTTYFQLLPNLQQLPNFYDLMFNVTGYDHCKYNYHLMTDNGRIDDIRDNAISYAICTKNGQSGSPVYLSNQPNTIVGIHVPGFPQMPHLMSLATMITESMINILEEWCFEMDPIFDVIDQSN